MRSIHHLQGPVLPASPCAITARRVYVSPVCLGVKPCASSRQPGGGKDGQGAAATCSAASPAARREAGSGSASCPFVPQSLLLQGLGPVIGVLIAVHVAALLFWIFSLIRSSMSARPRKADIKQH